MSESFSTRVFNLIRERKAQGNKITKDELAVKLGCSRTMLYNYENSDPEPMGDTLSRLSELESESGIEQMSTPREDEASYVVDKTKKQNIIPIVGMAHAGINEDFDEAAPDWRHTMVTTCPDLDAQGVKVLGECMSPFINEDDVLVAMPSRKPTSGGVSVARFKDGGVIVRRFEFTIDHKITAIANNVQYPVEYYVEDDFEWIWPVWDMHRKIWRG